MWIQPTSSWLGGCDKKPDTDDWEIILFTIDVSDYEAQIYLLIIFIVAPSLSPWGTDINTSAANILKWHHVIYVGPVI